MSLTERKKAFVELGKFLKSFIAVDNNKAEAIAGNGSSSIMDRAVEHAYHDNVWFVKSNVMQAIAAIAETMLIDELLSNWLLHYPQLNNDTILSVKKVGIIMAGNIPLVGFHDLLCVALSGHHAIVKPSSKDNALIRAVVDVLYKIEPRFNSYITVTQNRPVGIDAVISTGSNNSARYFESWYGDIPHIIRKNRSSVAILTGNESEDDLKLLSKDLFTYFGLGCRNVSSLFVPVNYDFNMLLNILSEFQGVNEHNEYNDCYRYQKAIMVMEQIPYYDTGSILLRNSVSLSAPIALVNYQKYLNTEYVKELIENQQDKIQCIVCKYVDINNAVEFGQTQLPALNDYADSIDTMIFLTNL